MIKKHRFSRGRKQGQHRHPIDIKSKIGAQEESLYANISKISPSLGRADASASSSQLYPRSDEVQHPRRHRGRRDARRRSAFRSFRVLRASASTDFKLAHDGLNVTRDARTMSSSSEPTAIFPGTGDSESDLADDTDEHDDDDVAEDDREGVDATDMDVDKDEGDGEGEGNRCCNALHDAVSRRARFLGGDCVDAALLLRSSPASGSAVFRSISVLSSLRSHLAASVSAARSAGSAPAGEDNDECSIAEAQRAHSSAPRACARRAFARTWRCATGLSERASKIVERGASMSRRRVRMAWRCGELVVLNSGEARQWVAAQTNAACGSRISALLSYTVCK